MTGEILGESEITTSLEIGGDSGVEKDQARERGVVGGRDR